MTYYPSFWHLRLVFFLLFLFGTALGCQDTPSIDSQSTVTQIAQKLTVHTLNVSSSSFTPEEIKKKEIDAWHLFDRSTSQAFSPKLEEGDEILLTLSFEKEVRLSLLKVYQSPLFVLTLEDKAGRALEGVSEIDLSALSETDAFSVLSLKNPLKTDSVRLRLTALVENASLPELEFWGASPHTSQAYQQKAKNSLSPEFQMISAAPNKFILAKEDAVKPTEKNSLSILEEEAQAGVSCRETLFFLEQDPQSFKRAYLSYDTDVFRPWVLRKSLNGSLFSGGHEPLPTTDSLQSFAEALDLSRLSLGKNTLTFCLPKGFLGQVRLENLSLLLEKDTGQNSIEQVFLKTPEGEVQALEGILLDKDNSTLAQISLEDKLLIDLERFLSLDTLRFSLHTPSALQSVTCISFDETRTELLSKKQLRHTLFAGENLFKLSKENACRSLEIQFQKDTSLQEISVSGSGVKEPIDWPKLQITSPLEHFGDTAILQGFALAPSKAKGPIRISIDGTPLKSVSGVFDEVLTRSENLDKPWTVLLEATFPDGSEFTQDIVLSKDGSVEKGRLLSGKEEESLSTPSPLAKKYGKVGESVVESISPEKENHIKLGTDVSLKIPENTQAQLQGTNAGLGALPPVSITHLNQPSVPKMSPWLINVTAPAGHAYEFLPHGIEFSEAVEVSVPFDPSLLPEGASLEDIKTYYYDETTQKWEELAQVGMDMSTQTIQSETTHFTIMANGVLAMPESPSVSSVAPNSLSSLSAANPLANIDLISPPVANSSGDANVSFPIWIPPGRGNYSPSVGLRYSSGSGNGFVGVGWNLPVSRIEIDTRFGVPEYDNPQTHRYLLDGQAIVPVSYELGPSERPNCQEGTALGRYRPRVEGSFVYILRCQDGALPPHWELRDTSGTLYIYGKEGALLNDYTDGSHIFAWYLNTVIDVHDNTTQFGYFLDTKPSNHSVVTEAWKQLYPRSINYTSNGTQNASASYQVFFTYDDQSLPPDDGTQASLASRKDQLVTGRPGFKVLTRFLLRSIQVKFQQRLLREYVLQYKTGQFEKSLLDTVTVFGEGGCLSNPNLTVFASPNCTGQGEEFYQHTFEYFQEEEGFTSPQVWETPAQDAAFTKSRNTSINGHLYLGASVPIPMKEFSAGVRVGLSGGPRKEQIGFYDINGDGLPDQVFQEETGLSAIFNQFVPPQDSSQSVLCAPGSLQNPCALSRNTPKGDPLHGIRNVVPIECPDDRCQGENAPLRMGKDESHSVSVGAQIFINPVEGGVSLAHSVTKGKEFFSDVNGDGFLDKVFPDGVLTSHRCPPAPANPNAPEGVCFGEIPFASVQTVNLTGDTDLNEMEAEIKKTLKPQDAVREWKAPVAGKVRIEALVQKEFADATMSDGVLVELFHEDQALLLGNHLFGNPILEQLNPGDPSVNSVHESAIHIPPDDISLYELTALGGDVLSVEKGESIYLKISSLQEDPTPERVPLDTVNTELTITYEETCFVTLGQIKKCTPVSAEASQLIDPTGLPVHTFHSADDFRLAGLSPSPIHTFAPGKLRIFGEIYKEETADDIRVCFQRFKSNNVSPTLLDLPCDASETFYEVQGNIETLDAEQSTPLPIDTITEQFDAGDLLIVRVESDFSFDPEHVLPFLQVEYDSICPPNDPCRAPTSAESTFLSFSQEKVQTFFPLLLYGTSGLPKGFLVPESGMMSIDGLLSASGDVLLAVRSPNRLIHKEEMLAGQTQVAIPAFAVEENETITIEILKENESTTVTWNPDANLNGNIHHLNTNVIYRKNQSIEEVDVEIFQGGYRNWYYGTFSGKTAFTSSWFQTDLWLQQNLTTASVRDAVASTLGEIPGSQPLSNLPFFLQFLDIYGPMQVAKEGSPLNPGEPSWISAEQSSFISATKMKGTRLGGYVFDPRDPPPPGTPEAKSFTRTDIDLNTAFIPTGFSRHSLARTYTTSLGVNSGLSANGNWGAIKQKADTIDFNGDGILDVLTPDGWVPGRLSENAPAKKELFSFPNSPNYLSKSRTLGGGIGLGINAIVQSLSSGGKNKSSGTKMPPNLGGGFSVSRSRLVEDLRDVNGDGLPDWVK